MEELEKELPRNWIPKCKRQEKMTTLLKNPFMKKEDDFLKSPAEPPTHSKVILEDKDISSKTQKACVKDMMTSYLRTAVTLARPC